MKREQEEIAIIITSITTVVSILFTVVLNPVPYWEKYIGLILTLAILWAEYFRGRRDENFVVTYFIVVLIFLLMWFGYQRFMPF